MMALNFAALFGDSLEKGCRDNEGAKVLVIVDKEDHAVRPGHDSPQLPTYPAHGEQTLAANQ